MIIGFLFNIVIYIDIKDYKNMSSPHVLKES